MKEELLAKLKKINPLNEHGVPKNQGNCQWCAIEGARVLLQGVEPREIPAHEGGNDPIEERVHYQHGNEDVTTENPIDFFDKIQELKPGELMLVSLESDDLDHAYIIYIDENSNAYLIDPDRQIVAELDDREDFLQNVKGWDEVSKVNYLNGDVNPDKFSDNVKVSICVLNQAAVEHSPLPEYGSEPSERLDY
ncbi:hypothetical protein [Legionella parisiensis]|uniref:Peptidase C39-like domain-containing protein n=1 Tax=Legionella parisiensis TaxID=45071 RepID=A0A1E5JRU8_9GAMM|nr:hypothetical protein [Legionella parisiensis]KTD41019.1 hypothetical protein Lpar_2336 [Legionella parisiensis]OEH47235.1 hypothetical protein lpari_01710 [Legionella parisiensis]STX76688.1 Uncharacterised protein [Legionella parisiensis]